MTFGKEIMLISLVLCLFGCGGINCYLHECHPKKRTLAPVTVKKGVKTKVLEDTRGFGGGGYYWGLIAEDPSIVEIEYQEEGRTITVYMTGKAKGKTTLYYVNHLVFNDPEKSISEYGADGEYYQKESNHFLLNVVTE